MSLVDVCSCVWAVVLLYVVLWLLSNTWYINIPGIYPVYTTPPNPYTGYMHIHSREASLELAFML